ncbi:hypothetical protein D9758_008287 [Tetrapyrgos nigripes]|uniref:Cytochrome P450 n=1 Tax=Tetrapyrgos nigripes TaxID=182062 RepID=A0A8H5LGT7_9AGAR|nr:hypothetical protein D9758_008287 [Tetrapyrgos nigripes]
MAEASFKEIPELFEVDLGEALTARTEVLSTFRELGPPDLCHVVKSNGRSGQRDVGSYHYISGVDASSSASLAAYINSLTYAIEDNSAWFSKGSTWKVKNGCYCCFNAFSRVDIRVDVKIPGGVQAYVIDLRGERHEATPELWQETYVSALLRAILYSDDPNYWLDAYRKLDPITTPEGEIRFLQAAEGLFMKGWQVGSDPEIQVATIISNHLTAGIMKYFGDSGRFQQAANLFEKLTAKEPEVASLLARSYIGMNEEVKAVQIMSSSIQKTPHSYTLLHAQCDLLRSKGRQDWAVKLARQAVNCAPSEFVTWEKVTECWIDLGEFENALLTLNSCPMFTFNGRDVHRNLTPAKVHLPFLKPIGEILPDRVKTEDDEADPALLRLPAPGLRGTWARAYALLTRLVSQIGWDELLKTRSNVFVMEEEYRMQKAHVDVTHVQNNNSAGGSGNRVIHEDGTVRDSIISGETTLADHGDGGDDDNASTRGIVSPHSPRSASVSTGVNGSGVGAKEKDSDNLDPPPGIPMIRISTESDRELDGDGESLKKDEPVTEPEEDTTKVDVNGETKPKVNGAFDADDDKSGLEKPAIAAAGEEDQEKDSSSVQAPGSESFSFSNKRLCERWLDNLFMVLYEDLRVWTIFRAEVAHFKTQHVAYRKTGLEWEILGELGLRLHHKEEAKEAFQRCLDTPRYSQKPWAKLMEMYSDEGDIQRCIQTAIRVAAYQWADYTEMTEIALNLVPTSEGVQQRPLNAWRVGAAVEWDWKAILSMISQGIELLVPVGVLIIGLAILYLRGDRGPLPPGPPRLPIVGNLKYLTVLGKPRPWRLFHKMAQEYGPLTYLELLGKPVVVINTARAAEDLLVRRAGNYSDRPRMIVGSEYMCGGLNFAIAPSGEIWRKMRRATETQLGVKSLIQYENVKTDEAILFAYDMLCRPEKCIENVLRATASVILSVVYDQPPLRSLDEPSVHIMDDFIHKLNRAAQPGSHIVEAIPVLDYIPTFLSSWKKNAKRDFQKFSSMFLKEYTTVKERLVGEQRPSLLAKLLEGGSRYDMTDLETAWAAAITYAAAYDTTSVTLSWFFLIMIQFPDIQKKAQEEIDTIVGQSRLPAFSDTKHLPYVTALIREIMRWRPGPPIGLPHASVKASIHYTASSILTLMVDDLRRYQDDYYNNQLIPAGSICIPNVWSINRDPDIYGADADEFRPERHLNPDGKLKDGTGEGHFTYGFGKRECIGKHFANKALFIDITMILWAMSIEASTNASGDIKIPDISEDAGEGVILHPPPFECRCRPRFVGVEATLEQARNVVLSAHHAH